RLPDRLDPVDEIDACTAYVMRLVRGAAHFPGVVASGHVPAFGTQNAAQRAVEPVRQRLILGRRKGPGERRDGAPAGARGSVTRTRVDERFDSVRLEPRSGLGRRYLARVVVGHQAVGLKHVRLVTKRA